MPNQLKLAPCNIARQFFLILNDRHIRYCHWKSNQHLLLGMTGQTDLDLLVDPTAKQSLMSIFNSLAFKQIYPSSKYTYPDIEHWLGFDYTSGRLIHVHLHYAIRLGGKYQKNYLLPVTNWLLNNRHLVDGVYLPNPTHELLLLIIRSLLKSGPTSPLPRNIAIEFNWLLTQTSITQLTDAVSQSDLPIDVSLLQHWLNNLTKRRLTPLFLLTARYKLKQQLKPFLTHPEIPFILIKFHRLLQRRPSRKTLATGFYLALVGADGSGKSRLAGDLQQWLAPQLKTSHIYFGIPKNYLFTLFRKSLSLIYLHYVWHVALARYRCYLHQQAIKRTSQGQITIAERFPLSEFHTMPQPMDGPRTTLSLEHQLYNTITPPNLTIVLRASLSVLQKRSNFTNPTLHHQKVSAVNTLKPLSRRHIINAELPYYQVLLNTKRLIWQSL